MHQGTALLLLCLQHSERITRLSPRPSGRCLRNVILPGAGDNLADRETTV